MKSPANLIAPDVPGILEVFRGAGGRAKGSKNVDI
jgi:hypothetical protein